MILFKFIILPLAPVFIYLIAFLWAEPAQSQSKITLVRDAETENVVKSYARPLFIAAGLNPDAVQINLILSPQLNAFVSNGQKIFINTGLLSTAEDVGQVIGVIAHETGHISGGHLVRMAQAIDQARTIDLITTVLGIGAAILANKPELGAVTTASGPNLGLRSFLQFSRTQESSADQAAIRFLEATQQSARGLYKFLGVIENQDLLSASRQDPYLQTHPITQDRMRTLEKHIEDSKYSDTPSPEQLQIQHNRIRAKIIAYSFPLAVVLQKYPETDQSVWARYGRAMAYYRLPDLKKALGLINELLTQYPQDPYFHELKAQMLFEHGRVYEAIASYKRAIEFVPPSDILYQALGMAQVSSDDPALLKEAETNLRHSIRLRPNIAATWRQLAIAYGRQNKMGQYQLALGEEALLNRLKEKAISHAKRAEEMFKTGSIEWQQAQDITTAAQNMK